MDASSTDTATVDLEFLAQEFNRFRSELAGMKHKLSDNAAAALDQMGAYLNRDAVSSRLSTLEAEFDKLSGKVKDSSKVAVDRLEAEVTERPLAALAVAFGVGLMAAQLLRRK
ncbi:MAG: hypothetical protein B7Z75_07580 [Acidocella sp. 20-57-95]|nr:MAG: hypothetical protein B7Z75_07580 [Acidocella sp. 20-57-95]HQT62928.1 hypothetical protein [Acidocella sp.]HQU03994.1 hypothetical protein [Acidocella sp.]